MPTHLLPLQFTAMEALSDLFSHCCCCCCYHFNDCLLFHLPIFFHLAIICMALSVLLTFFLTSFNYTNQRELELKKMTDE